MNPQHRPLQRSIDGELGAAEAAALQHLVAANPEAKRQLGELESVHALLQRHATGVRELASAHNHAVITRIAAALPTAAPVREHHIRITDIAAAVLVVSLLAMTYGVVGSLRDLLPLTLIAMVSVIAGSALLLGAGLIQRAHASLFSRLLRRRLSIGRGELLVYRLAGVAIVIGGVWLLR